MEKDIGFGKKKKSNMFKPKTTTKKSNKHGERFELSQNYLVRTAPFKNLYSLLEAVKRERPAKMKSSLMTATLQIFLFQTLNHKRW